MFGCVTHTIIRNYVCIGYLASESRELRELPVVSVMGFKYEETNYDKILGIGISDLLMTLMSCHGFLKNKDTVVILKCPKRMFEYYLSK